MLFVERRSQVVVGVPGAEECGRADTNLQEPKLRPENFTTEPDSDYGDRVVIVPKEKVIIPSPDCHPGQ